MGTGNTAVCHVDVFPFWLRSIVYQMLSAERFTFTSSRPSPESQYRTTSTSGSTGPKTETRGALLSWPIRRTRLPRNSCGSLRPMSPYRPIGFPGGTLGYGWNPTSKTTLFPKMAAHGKYGDPSHRNSGKAALVRPFQSIVLTKTYETRWV